MAASVRLFILSLAKQTRHVILDRLLREEHGLGDLTVGLALGDEVQDARLLGERALSSGLTWVGWQMRSTTRATALGSISDAPPATFFTSSIRSRALICLST